MDSACSVTVVGSRRRLDVSLPAGLPVVELVWDLADMLAEPEHQKDPPHWGLVRVGGAVLDGERGLADQGVIDGSLLFLRDLTTPPAPPAVDDFAEAVAVAVEARGGRWTAATRQAVLAGVAATWVLVAAAAAYRIGDLSVRAVTSLAAAAVTGLCGVVLSRRLRYQATGAALTLIALPLWAVGGAALTGLLGGVGPALVPAVAGSLAAGALVALLAGAGARAPAVAILSGVGAPAAVVAIFMAWGLDPLRTAAVLAPLALAAARLAPGLAVRLARLGGGRTVASGSVGSRVDSGHRLLGAMIIGVSFVIAVSSTVLALYGGWFERGLTAAVALATAAHVRHFRFAVDAAPLAVASLVGLSALEVAYLRQLDARPELRPAEVALALATAAILAGAAIVGRRRQLSALWRRRLDQLEALAVTATIPLALGSLGLYSTISVLAHRLA